MEPVRPLRDVFDDLADRPAGVPGGPAADPAAALDGAGHPDLPGDLVAEALVSYAATAPPQVAEQLGPFVTAHSGVPAVEDDGPAGPAELPEPADGLALLDGAGTGDGWADPLALDGSDPLDTLDDADPPATDGADGTDGTDGFAHHPEAALDHGFGTGAPHDVDPSQDRPGDLEDLDHGPAEDGPTDDGLTGSWLDLDPAAPEHVPAPIDELHHADGSDGDHAGHDLDGHDPVDLDG